METLENNNENFDTDFFKELEKSHKRGKFIGGLFVVIAGSLYLAKEMGVLLPDWLFTWQALVITLGIFITLKHGFKKLFGFVLIAVGTLFLLKDYYTQFDFTNYITPILIIFAGLMIMFRPRRRWNRKHDWKKWQRYHQWKHNMHTTNFSNPDDHMELNTVFASLKKNIISKNFKGGEINCVFGGAEVNLMQADINEKAELEVNCVFAGIRLIVPSHWEIKSEISAVLGSVEDKREVRKDIFTENHKVLILKGSTVFGGIEIQNY